MDSLDYSSGNRPSLPMGSKSMFGRRYTQSKISMTQKLNLSENRKEKLLNQNQNHNSTTSPFNINNTNDTPLTKTGSNNNENNLENNNNLSNVNKINNRIFILSPLVLYCNEFENKKSDFIQDDTERISLGFIGHGLKVTSKSTNKNYVIKVIKKEKAIKNGKVALLNQQIENMYKVKNIYFLKLLNHFEDDINLYLIYEYLNNKEKNIKDFIKDNSEIFNSIYKYNNKSADNNQNENEYSKIIENIKAKILKYFKQIVIALSYLHNLNIYCLTLEPETIFIDEDDNIRLTDYGFSKVTKNLMNKRNGFKTDNNCFVNAYVAPELIYTNINNHNLEVHRSKGSYQCDLWQIGVLLYEMITFHLPFDNLTNKDEFISAIKKEAFDYKKEMCYLYDENTFTKTVNNTKVINNIFYDDEKMIETCQNLVKNLILSNMDYRMPLIDVLNSDIFNSAKCCCEVPICNNCSNCSESNINRISNISSSQPNNWENNSINNMNNIHFSYSSYSNSIIANTNMRSITSNANSNTNIMGNTQISNNNKNYEEIIQNLKNENSNLTDEIAKLKEENEKLESEKNELVEKNKQLEEIFNEDNNYMSQEIVELKSQIRTLEFDIDFKQMSLEEEKEKYESLNTKYEEIKSELENLKISKDEMELNLQNKIDNLESKLFKQDTNNPNEVSKEFLQYYLSLFNENIQDFKTLIENYIDTNIEVSKKYKKNINELLDSKHKKFEIFIERLKDALNLENVTNSIINKDDNNDINNNDKELVINKENESDNDYDNDEDKNDDNKNDTNGNNNNNDDDKMPKYKKKSCGFKKTSLDFEDKNINDKIEWFKNQISELVPFKHKCLALEANNEELKKTNDLINQKYKVVEDALNTLKQEKDLIAEKCKKIGNNLNKMENMINSVRNFLSENCPECYENFEEICENSI